MKLQSLLSVFAVYSVVCLSAVAAARPPAGGASRSPNLLILLTDDQRLDTLSVYNDTCPIQTPNIDRLANEGIRFDQGFVTTPICVVSRASILTGRYESNHRLHHFETLMPEDVFEQSYPVLLRDAGYFSGHLGKYGVGIRKDQEARFDVFEAQEGQGPKFREYKGKRMHDSEWLTVKTDEFLDAVPEDRPFVLQVSYKEPHNSSCPAPEDDAALDYIVFERKPNDTPEARAAMPDASRPSLNDWDYANTFNKDGDINGYLRNYHEKIMGVERSVGKILEMLETRGMADNTVIIFLSDHGTHFGEKQLAGKWTPYDESLRIPFIIYDPRPAAQKKIVRNEMVLNIDIAPTLLDLAGVKVPEVMDGRSLAPLLTSASSLMPSAWRTQFAYEHFTSPSHVPAPLPRTDGVRTETMKYVRWFDVDPVQEELFDLKNDPLEMNNLIGHPEQAEQLNELRAKYDAWREANPSTYTYEICGRRAQSGSPVIDWEQFKEVRPEVYAKIAEQVKAHGVSWEQAVNDRATRLKISKAAGFWY